MIDRKTAVALWVPLKRMSATDDPTCPHALLTADVPAEVRDWERDASDLRPLGDLRPHSNINEFTKIYVNPKDADKCKKAVPESTVPALDRFWVKMLETCQTDFNAKTEAFFDAHATLGTARQRKDVLLQAVARGLSAEKAEQIRAKHNLPRGAAVGH